MLLFKSKAIALGNVGLHCPVVDAPRDSITKKDLPISLNQLQTPPKAREQSDKCVNWSEMKTL